MSPRSVVGLFIRWTPTESGKIPTLLTTVPVCPSDGLSLALGSGRRRVRLRDGETDVLFGNDSPVTTPT